MTPPLLSLRDIKLTFGSTPLLTGADLIVGERERLCLVGRNGSGKSTLMKVAAGIMEADDGEFFLQPGTTVRYLSQEPDLSGFQTVGDYVRAGLEEGDDSHRVSLYLEALELDDAQTIATLSGGEARKAALVRTLAPEPDILLLDEPTNHLDLPAIEWLEAELAGLRSALVIISHDRRFLENLTTATLWVDRGRTRLLRKGFSAFEDWRDTVLQEEELEAHKLDRKIVREEHWVTHGVSGRRKRNMKRLADLGALRKQRAERLAPTRTVSMSFGEAESSGKLVARVENIAKRFGEHTLVRNFSTRIARGDRIGIVGPNGAGKTTLVRLLTGELLPDEGVVKLGANIEMLVIDQKRSALDGKKNLRDTLTGGGTDLVRVGETTKHVIAYMKDFLFDPAQAGTAVEKLSGGERGRLLLAAQLRHPSNLLVLDEPTNDLDLETLDLLQETISDYAGTVILVSHDRDFIDRICTSVITPGEKAGTWIEYAGGYSDMIAQRGTASTAEEANSPAAAPTRQGSSVTSGRSSSGKMSYKDKHALETLPATIEKLTVDIDKVNAALAAPDLFEKDPKRFGQLVKLLEKTQSELAHAEERWLELEALREELEGI